MEERRETEERRAQGGEKERSGRGSKRKEHKLCICSGSLDWDPKLGL